MTTRRDALNGLVTSVTIGAIPPITVTMHREAIPVDPLPMPNKLDLRLVMLDSRLRQIEELGSVPFRPTVAQLMTEPMKFRFVFEAKERVDLPAGMWAALVDHEDTILLKGSVALDLPSGAKEIHLNDGDTFLASVTMEIS